MKKELTQNRRSFIKSSAALTGAIAVAGGPVLTSGCSSSKKSGAGNALPKWKGFNLLDFFSWNPDRAYRQNTEDHFKWMSDWGFDFVRIPMAYPSYLDIDYSQDITPDQVYDIKEEALEKVDHIVYLGHKYNMHVSMNLHRAPGYCINAGFHEPFNLWKDEEAQKAFYWHWDMWAKRYKNISREKISFDLLNEPAMIEDMNNQHSSKTIVPGDLYAKIAIKAAETIWGQNSDHLVIADGNQVGSKVIPEIAHLPIGQSCRGYNPGIISHYKASWSRHTGDDLPELKYPGQVGDQYLSRDMLEEFYAPWIEFANSGGGVHCGECGCYNKTPHDIFLAWFSDVTDILMSNDIGFALWEFDGTFGVLNSGREDVDYEDWHGQKLDRKLLDLIMKA